MKPAAKTQKSVVRPTSGAAAAPPNRAVVNAPSPQPSPPDAGRRPSALPTLPPAPPPPQASGGVRERLQRLAQEDAAAKALAAQAKAAAAVEAAAREAAAAVEAAARQAAAAVETAAREAAAAAAAEASARETAQAEEAAAAAAAAEAARLQAVEDERIELQQQEASRAAAAAELRRLQEEESSRVEAQRLLEESARIEAQQMEEAGARIEAQRLLDEASAAEAREESTRIEALRLEDAVRAAASDEARRLAEAAARIELEADTSQREEEEEEDAAAIGAIGAAAPAREEEMLPEMQPTRAEELGALASTRVSASGGEAPAWQGPASSAAPNRRFWMQPGLTSASLGALSQAEMLDLVRAAGPLDGAHGHLLREKGTGTFSYYLEGANTEHVPGCLIDARMLLRAQRRRRLGGGAFDIRLASSAAGEGSESATVLSLSSNWLGTEYIARDDAGAETMAIVFAVNPLGVAGPRRCSIALPGSGERQPPGALLAAARDPGPPGTSRSRSVLLLHARSPVWSEAAQSFVLNFGGRVTLSSCKNMQLDLLDDTQDAHGPPQPPAFQVGRVSTDLFTVDFRHPLSFLQAFAIALAAVDHKPAVE